MLQAGLVDAPPRRQPSAVSAAILFHRKERPDKGPKGNAETKTKPCANYSVCNVRKISRVRKNLSDALDNKFATQFINALSG